jgi:hypothetical protein
VLQQLQGTADRVRELDPTRRAAVEDAEHDAADRVGRQCAVPEQVGQRLVPDHGLVLEIRLDEVLEVVLGEVVPPYDGDQPLMHRQPRQARGPDQRQVGTERLQRGGAVTGAQITDVVDGTGEGVDLVQVVPHLSRQHPQRHWKVLGPLPTAQCPRIARFPG